MHRRQITNYEDHKTTFVMQQWLVRTSVQASVLPATQPDTRVASLPMPIAQAALLFSLRFSHEVAKKVGPCTK